MQKVKNKCLLIHITFILGHSQTLVTHPITPEQCVHGLGKHSK